MFCLLIQNITPHCYKARCCVVSQLVAPRSLQLAILPLSYARCLWVMGYLLNSEFSGPEHITTLLLLLISFLIRYSVTLIIMMIKKAFLCLYLKESLLPLSCNSLLLADWQVSPGYGLDWEHSVDFSCWLDGQDLGHNWRGAFFLLSAYISSNTATKAPLDEGPWASPGVTGEIVLTDICRMCHLLYLSVERLL